MLFSPCVSYRRIRSATPSHVLPRLARPPARGTAARRGRRPRLRSRPPGRAPPGPRRRLGPSRSSPRRRPSARDPRPTRWSARRRRLSAARRYGGWTGTRSAAASEPSRPPCDGPGRDGARAPGAWSSRPSGSTLRGLAGLLAHVLVLVADPLALVGLGLADLADVGGNLADLLLVVAAHNDRCGGRGLELDPLGRNHVHRVGVSDLDLEVVALHRGAVADAHDRQALLVALGHALDHVRDQRAGEPVQAAMASLVAGTLHTEHGVLAHDLHRRVDLLGERATRSLHGHHGVIAHDDVDPARDLDGLLADPTHPLPSSRPARRSATSLHLPHARQDLATDSLAR